MMMSLQFDDESTLMKMRVSDLLGNCMLTPEFFPFNLPITE